MRDIDWGYYKDFCMLFHLKECDLSNLEYFMNVITYAYGSVLYWKYVFIFDYVFRIFILCNYINFVLIVFILFKCIKEE